MSLEALLEAHSSAVKENTDTLNKLLKVWNQLAKNAERIKTGEAFNAAGAPFSEEAKTPKEIADIAVVRAKTDATVAGTADPKSVAVSQPSETAAALPASKPGASNPAPSIVTYEDVKTLVLKVSKDKGRDAAAAVLAGFGVAKAPELKTEQYADAVTQLQAALA